MSSNTNYVQNLSSNNSSEPQTASWDFMESPLSQIFLKDEIFLYASDPLDSIDKSVGLLKASSNDSLEAVSDKNHKKSKGRKNKNNVETEGNINNIGWWEKEPVRRQWSCEEDMLLVQLVQCHGVKNWARIAEKFPQRVGKQCRERWQNYLRPNIMKNAWSEEEDKLLISLHQQIGNKWADIARKMPGRTENSIKNHWNATKRRQISSKNHEKINYPSLLKNYITSLTSSSSSSSSPNHQINIQQNSGFDSNPCVPSSSGYKPADVAPNEMDFDDVASHLVDELVFDPTNEMDFLNIFWQ